MAYDQALADRVQRELSGNAGFTQRKMFGGIGYMCAGNMAAGIIGDDLMVRVSAHESDGLLAEPHTHLMEQGGRPMRGFVLVAPAGVEDDAALALWLGRGWAYAASLPPK